MQLNYHSFVCTFEISLSVVWTVLLSENWVAMSISKDLLRSVMSVGTVVPVYCINQSVLSHAKTGP